MQDPPPIQPASPVATSSAPDHPSPPGIGRLPPWGTRSLPRFPGMIRALGPGVVWMALAQGSGELVWWPYIIAKYGLGFLFLLIPACLIQYPVNYEIGRYTLLTGESVWQGFIRLNRWVAAGMWLLMTVSFMWLGGFVAANGMDTLTDLPRGWSESHQRLLWAYVFMAVFLVALLLSRVVYHVIERLMMVIAVVTVVGLVLACCQRAVLDALGAFCLGLIRPDWPADRAWDPRDAERLLTAITFAGLGGFWTLFYSYWLREKGSGMAAHIGQTTGPITGRRQLIPQVGFLPPDSKQDIARWRTWIRFLRLDILVGILGNLLTTLMCCLLAYALLYPSGQMPTEDRLIHVQAEFFRSAWGTLGALLFLVLATAFLADTWMTTVDAISRVHTDVWRAYLPSRNTHPNTLYWIFVLAAGIISAITVPLDAPGELILTSAVIGFAGTVIFTFCLLIWNHVVLPLRLPAPYRPHRFAWVGIALAFAVYLGLAVAYLYVRFGPEPVEPG